MYKKHYKYIYIYNIQKASKTHKLMLQLGRYIQTCIKPVKNQQNDN